MLENDAILTYLRNILSEDELGEIIKYNLAKDKLEKEFIKEIPPRLLLKVTDLLSGEFATIIETYEEEFMQNVKNGKMMSEYEAFIFITDTIKLSFNKLKEIEDFETYMNKIKAVYEEYGLSYDKQILIANKIIEHLKNKDNFDAIAELIVGKRKEKNENEEKIKDFFNIMYKKNLN